MSFKGRFLSVLTLAIAFAAFGTVSFAQQTTTQDNGVQKQDKEGRQLRKDGRRGGFGMRGGHGGFGMLRGIELTDAQKQQIKSIMDSNKPDEAAMTQMRTLRDAKRSGTLTADQQAQLKAFRDQQRVKMESVHQQILSILTPEQKQQIEQRQQEMKQRREQWKQKKQSTEKTIDS